MKITNIKLLNYVQGLNAFVNKDKAVPFKLSYAINKNLGMFRSALEPFEKTRNEILSKNLSVEEQNEAFEDLCEIEIEIEDIYKVPMSLAEGIADLSTKDFMAIEFMLEDEGLNNATAPVSED